MRDLGVVLYLSFIISLCAVGVTYGLEQLVRRWWARYQRGHGERERG